MSITDELREWAVNHRAELDMGQLYPAMIERIADRIDAEHERECKEQYACGVEHGIGASIDASMIQTHGYVELPKDADGVPIRIGDVLTDDAEFKSEGKVARLMLEDEGWMVGLGCAGWTEPSIHEWHHYHAPTVEDVLRDVVTLCHNTWKEGSAFEFYDVDDVMKSGNIADFAAKLRLAGDDE